MYRFEITTEGKTAHTGSTKNEGINAITKMMELLLSLGKMKPYYIKHKMFPPPKITAGTVIQGGTAINIVPDRCTALIDCRLSYGQTKKTIVADISKQIRKLKSRDKELSVKIREIGYQPPYITDKNEKIVKISSKNIEIVYGFKPKLMVSGGATDGNYLSTTGMPIVVFGPDGKNAHSENEYVIANSIVKISKVYALSAMDFLGVKK